VKNQTWQAHIQQLEDKFVNSLKQPLEIITSIAF
jgi:hypothetical protein